MSRVVVEIVAGYDAAAVDDEHECDFYDDGDESVVVAAVEYDAVAETVVVVETTWPRR